MQIKLIKNDDDYYKYLSKAEELIDVDPEDGSVESNDLALFTLIIEDYEKRRFKSSGIDAVDAIQFRMEEQGLRQQDLVSLIGSKSRVSEVLRRKRALTLPMIRALSKGLGIPAELLISEVKKESVNESDSLYIDLSKFPTKVMSKRGWLLKYKKMNLSLEESVKAFFEDAFMGNNTAALFRRNFKGAKINEKAYYSTLAWSTKVINSASLSKPPTKFCIDNINNDVISDLARLSWYSDGPIRAINFLLDLGIKTIIEPRLPNSVIDGAAMLTPDNCPVIGLTLRIDRIDYFWFTLMHEVAHVWKHLNSYDVSYIDRLDGESSDSVEHEADAISRNSFILKAVWDRSGMKFLPSKNDIQVFADKHHINPAIVAGRIQYETGHYERYRDLLGQGTIRKMFSDVIFD